MHQLPDGHGDLNPSLQRLCDWDLILFFCIGAATVIDSQLGYTQVGHKAHATSLPSVRSTLMALVSSALTFVSRKRAACHDVIDDAFALSFSLILSPARQSFDLHLFARVVCLPWLNPQKVGAVKHFVLVCTRLPINDVNPQTTIFIRRRSWSVTNAVQRNVIGALSPWPLIDT